MNLRGKFNGAQVRHRSCGLVEIFGFRRVVGEHCSGDTSMTVRTCAATTSEDADMSSDKAGEKPARRKPKVS